MLDEFRVGLVRQNARKWREQAAELRRQAEETDELATAVVRVIRYGGPDGVVEEPQLVFVRTQLRDRAAAADTTAQHLEDRLAVGDLAGESLQLLCSQLEEPAEAEIPVPVG